MKSKIAAPARGISHDALRQLVARAGLGFVLIWFGVGELWQPSQWTGYIPAFLHGLPQVPMILVHGYVLFAAGALLLLGQWTRPMAALAALMLLSIIGSLMLNGGGTSLYVRDIGLLALSLTLLLEKDYSYTLDDLWGRTALLRPSAR